MNTMQLKKFFLFVALASLMARLTHAGADMSKSTQLLVKWKDGPHSGAARIGNMQIGSAVVRNLNAIGWQLIALPEHLGVGAAIAHYSALSSVAAVEPDMPLRMEAPVPASENRVHGQLNSLSFKPNDPYFNTQWYLQKIGAPTAWQTTTGSTNIVVALIDTGVDYTHPDLAANMWRNPGESGLDPNGNNKATNGIDDDENGYIDDLYGINAKEHTGNPMDKGSINAAGALFSHGTACAGLIGAAGNNGRGLTGLNWSVRIMALAATRKNPHDREVSYSAAIAEAFDYIIAMRKRGVDVRVTSNSYGPWLNSRAIADAIAAAGQAGILNVCAASNAAYDNDLNSIFPAGYDDPSIVSVAASTPDDRLAAFSSFGRSSVDLAAPGTDMTTTSIPNSYVTDFGGTSGAAPLVAGAVALLASANPMLTADEIKAALLGSADINAALKKKVVCNGRLNIGRALQNLTNTDLPPIVITALPSGSRTSPNAIIQLTFSHRMERVSVEDSFSLSPPIAGKFEWSNENRTVSFIPATALDPSSPYSGHLSANARDIEGRQLDGNFDRLSQGAPLDDYTWSFHFAPANDDFAQAAALAGITGTLSENNSGASSEVGEPEPVLLDFTGSSLWYRWTAVEAGWITFDTLATSSPLNTILTAYAGEQINELTEEAVSDDYGPKPLSRISFATVPGRTYSISIAARTNLNASFAIPAFGTFTLKWYPTPPPRFTGAQFSPSSAAPGTRITLTGTNFTGATAVLFNGALASFTNAPTNNLDLRITAIVPPNATSGPITILTPHGNVTSTAIFEVLRPTLAITPTAATELTISWSDPTFSLDSSTDLHAWNQLAPPGATNTTVSASENHAFFRLRRQ